MVPHTGQNGHHIQINKQQVLERMWRKANPHALLVRMQIGAATVENSMEFPSKFKNGAAYDPVIPFLDIYLKKPKHEFKRIRASLR